MSDRLIDRKWRDLYLQAPEPRAVRCEVSSAGDQCAEPAAYAIAVAGRPPGRVCARCLDGWVRRFADQGRSIVVQRLSQ